MISEKMQQAINDQINAELYSGYLYLSMSAYFEADNLPGFANWMTVQYHEEVAHAMKFIHYLHERGGRVLLKPIEGPETRWDSPLAALEATYAHEQVVTGRIHDLVKLARAEGDTASEVFLQWYVTEQVEEEASADEIVQVLNRIGEQAAPLFMLDRQLGSRTFAPSASQE